MMPVKSLHHGSRIVLFLAAISLASCFEEEVSLSVRHPVPGPMALQGLHSVAVALVDGQTGKTIVTALRQELEHSSALAVAAPADVDEALGRFSGPMQNRDWARLARDLGVDAVFFGIVDQEAVDFECQSSKDYASGTTRYRRYVDTTLQARIWAVNRYGQTLGEVSGDGSLLRQGADAATAVGIHNHSDEVCDMLFPAVDPQQYMAPAAQLLARRFVDAMRPTDKDSAVVLYTETSQWNAQHALSLAKGHLWDEAAALYRKGLVHADSAGTCVTARIYYNLGVCLGQDGDALQAQIALRQAQARGRYCPFLQQNVTHAMRMIDDIGPAMQQAEIVGWSH